MKAHDQNGESREGSGRVGIFKATDLLRCYTLECNYHSGVSLNHIPQSDLEESPISDNYNPIYINGPPPFDIDIFEDVGKSICISILDLIGKNEFSRLKNSDFTDFDSFKLSVAEHVAQIVPYRYFNDIRKAAKNKEALFKLIKDEETEIIPEESSAASEESKETKKN